VHFAASGARTLHFATLTAMALFAFFLLLLALGR